VPGSSDSACAMKATGAYARHRALEYLVIANWPDGRVVALNLDPRVRLGEDCRHSPTIRQQGAAFEARPDHGRVQGPSGLQRPPAMGGTRGCGGVSRPRATGNELWRWYAIPNPGEPGSETLDGQNNAWKTAWRCGLWQPAPTTPSTGSQSCTVHPVPQIRSRVPPRATIRYNQAVVRSTRHRASSSGNFQYNANDSWYCGTDRAIHMLMTNTREKPSGHHFGPHGLLTNSIDCGNGSFIKGRGQSPTIGTGQRGLIPNTGMPVEYYPSSMCRNNVPEARALRRRASL